MCNITVAETVATTMATEFELLMLLKLKTTN